MLLLVQDSGTGLIRIARTFPPGSILLSVVRWWQR